MAIINDDDADGDTHYGASRALFKRWGQGIDLEPLIELLGSERSRDRLRGAYYLGEVWPLPPGLDEAARKLADDVIPDCQRAFISYIRESGQYDQPIGTALASLLSDLSINLPTRKAVIEWAIATSDENFADFARLVEAGIGLRKPVFRDSFSVEYWKEAQFSRATRGLEIIRRVQGGDDIQKIRQEIPEEDSMVFDSLDFSRARREQIVMQRELSRRASADKAN